ncbi:MAG: hypothetical protein OXR84_14965 [Magnetovibrio sp.]|nr:hypothetical protein [Magnetovibrio sp.]
MPTDDLRHHQRFALSIEQAIRLANREVLHPVVDPLTEEKVLSVAVAVAKRRAAYIEATLQIAGQGDDKPSGEKLRELRLAYQESRDAFAELMTTIERGYVDLPSG